MRDEVRIIEEMREEDKRGNDQRKEQRSEEEKRWQDKRGEERKSNDKRVEERRDELMTKEEKRGDDKRGEEMRKEEVRATRVVELSLIGFSIALTFNLPIDGGWDILSDECSVHYVSVRCIVTTAGVCRNGERDRDRDKEEARKRAD